MQHLITKEQKSSEQNKRVNVIMYELNEVPWDIIDLYIQKRPRSNLASLISNSSCLTTVNEDSTFLQPWRTWPTFHKSMYPAKHNSFELGQDPTTFYGENIWDVADANGLRIGLFGPMQSWPPYEPRNGGFYVPDTFSRSPEAFPESMKLFQAFNLQMTNQNSFSSEVDLNIREVISSGIGLLSKGITSYSVYNICLNLVKERVSDRYKAGRPILQVLPSFDLYWKLHRQHKPNLSIFFTNHVASMMHRHWGDGVPGYAEAYDYKVDKVYGNFITEAMDHFDRQLGRIMSFISQNPDTILIVASSMGQGPEPYRRKQESYVVEDINRLISALNLRDAEKGLAMYPSISLKFPSQESATAAMAPLQSVTNLSNLEPLFKNFVLKGNTLSFIVDCFLNPSNLSKDIKYSPLSEDKRVIQCQTDELGISVKIRPGGHNTAYHIPDGIFISYGAGIAPNSSRQKVSILNAAPTILSLLNLPQPKSMQGKPIPSLAESHC